MRRIDRPFLLGLALLLLAHAPAAAQPPGAAEPLDLDGAVRIALENHPLLGAADEEIAAAEADRQTAGTGYLPRIDLVEDFARSDNPVFVFASKLGQQKFTTADFNIDTLNNPDAFTNFATRVELRQSIWDGGRTDKGKKAAEYGIEAARESRRRTEDEIIFGAHQAFWNQVLAEKMLSVAIDAEKAAGANAELAAELVESGLAVPSDRLSAQVRLAEVRSMRIRAEQEIEVARAGLRLALGVDDDRTYLLVPPATDVDPGAESLDARLERARRERADLAAMRRRTEQARTGEKMSKSRRMPQLGLGAAYEMNGDRIFGNDGSNWAVGINVRIPLFEGNETKGNVARSRADQRRLEHYTRALEQGIEMQVRAAWADRLSAAERLDVAGFALEQAGEALRIVRDRYGEGMAMMVELLAAEAAHTEARANLVAAERDVALAQAGLDLATGVRPSDVTVETERS